LEVKNNENLFSCSKAVPVEEGPKPLNKHKIDKKDKVLRIFEVSLIEFSAQGEQPNDKSNPDQNKPNETNQDDQTKKDLIEKNIREIQTRLKTAGINDKQETEILGNS
jgi:hypothetical protein